MFSLHELILILRKFCLFPNIQRLMIPDVSGRRLSLFAPGPDYIKGSLYKCAVMCYKQESEATLSTDSPKPDVIGKRPGTVCPVKELSS